MEHIDGVFGWTYRVRPSRHSALKAFGTEDIPFIGRKSELELIKAMVREAHGNIGSALLVSGPTGIGKTALLRQAASLVSTTSTLVFVSCSSVPMPSNGIPAQILKHFKDEDSSDAVLGWTSAYERIVVAAANRRPVVILIDDIHLANVRDLELVDAIVEGTAFHRVVAILSFTTRDTTLVPKLAKPLEGWLRHGAVMRRLPPLSESELGLLVRNVTRNTSFAIQKPVMREILRLSNGNPRYVRELLVKEPGDRRTDSLIPQSARVAIASLRLSMSAKEIDVLAVAALIGEHFKDAWLKLVVRSDDDLIGNALQVAVDTDIVVECRGQPGYYAFCDTAIQKALASNVVLFRRRVFHARIARVLVANRVDATFDHLIAEHSEAAGKITDAARWLLSTAERMAEQRQYHAAAELCERAAVHLKNDFDKSASLQDRAAHYYEQANAYEKAIPLREGILANLSASDDAERYVRVLQPLIVDYWWAPERTVDALAAMEVLKGIKSPEARKVLARQMISWATRLVNNGFVAEARAALRVVRKSDVGYEIKARYQLVSTLTRSSFVPVEQSLAAVEKAGDLAQRTTGELDAWWIWIEAAGLACRAGRLDRATVYAERATQAAIVAGHTAKATPWTTLLFAEIKCLAGDIGGAHELVSSLPSVNDAGDMWEANAAAINVFIGLHAGDPILIDAFFNADLLRNAVALRETNLCGMYLRAFPEVMLARGLTEDLISLLGECVRQRLVDPLLSTQLAIARFAPIDCLEAARREVSDRETALDGEVARATRPLFEAFVAKRLGDTRKCQSFAERAAVAYRKLGWALHEALSLELSGDTDTARAIYAQVGALRDVARLSSRQKRKATRAYFGATLTPREREVAILICDDTTNPNIASRLKLSERTVHHHVEAIFSKLGIRARWQLTAAHIPGNPERR
jgi:DNA-binding CsgD family transcriptional regulator